MVKSASRVMQILDLVGKSKKGLKHLDIAAGLGIPKGSLSLLLSDLVEGEFLTLDRTTKRFQIGPQILVLAGRYLADRDIVTTSQPFIRDLINATNESCGIGIRKGNEVLIVWRENSDEPLKWDLKIGDQYPMHASAFGKAILAHLQKEDLEHFFSTAKLIPMNEKTITDEQTLRRELEGIYNGDIAYSREENFIGIISMGVPIFDNSGKVTASISIPIPRMRFTAEKENLVGRKLKQAGVMLSRELGYLK